MGWGTISAESNLGLVIIPFTENSEGYFKILGKGLVPFRKNLSLRFKDPIMDILTVGFKINTTCRIRKSDGSTPNTFSMAS